MMKNIMTAGLVAMALAVSSMPANAAPPYSFDGPAPQLVVSYKDLDLHKDADVQTLMGRVTSAAVAVCQGHRDGQAGIRPQMAFADCREQVTQRTVAAIDKPVLTALYTGKATATPVKLASRR